MKRLIIVVCCCASLIAWGQKAASTDEPNPPRLVYRCLILIDTSSAMSRQKDVAADTVSKLILGGFGGRLRAGDAWSIWTFDERLHTNDIPLQAWDPRQRRDVATRAYRFLDEQRFNKKKAVMDKALAAISDEAKHAGDLTVFLFTDGSRPVKGTPFDKSINEIFAKHASGMRKVKKPFVTVLVAQAGIFSDHAVSPGGGSIYVPRLAGAQPPDQTEAAVKPDAAAANNASQPTPNRKPMTVEEISAALRQSQKVQTNPPAAAPAPLIVRGTNTSGLAAGAPDNSAAGTAAPNSNSITVSPDTAISQDAVAVETNAPQAALTAAAQAEKTRTDGPPNKALAVRDEATVPRPPQTNDTLPGTTRTTRDEVKQLSGSPAVWPQTAAIAQPESGSSAWKYLVAAGAMLLAALTLAWLYIRSIRYVPRPSLISQSMDKEKK